MKIKSERLELEPLSCTHYTTAVKYSLDPENTRLMCFLPCDDGEEVMNYLRKCESQWKKDKPDYLDAAVLLDGVHIGAISIEFFEEYKIGELGWIISREYWGRGYAAEAAQVFMDFCKTRFGLKKFIAHTDSDNIASASVAKKLGMNLISETRGRKNRNSDEIRNEYLFELELPY